MALDKSPVHGTAVAVDERGFLLIGASGSGKSGLALQMMALGAALVADDQVALCREDEGVTLSAPPALAGLIEARFVGLLRAEAKRTAPLAFVVDLVAEPEGRMPQSQSIDVLGCRIDLINGRNVPNLASALMILGRGGRRETR